jgi:hypothetical protein
MLGAVDASQAIAELTDISPQVQSVVATAPDGSIAGSNLAAESAERLLDGARRLLDEAGRVRAGIAQLEAATTSGSVFVVRDAERLIAATTTPEPTVGLVFYDLKTCLRSIDLPAPKPKPRRRAAPKKAGGAAKAKADDGEA